MPSSVMSGIGSELWGWNKNEGNNYKLGGNEFATVGSQLDIHNVSYSVPLGRKKGNKTLLRHVGFSLEGGDMCALMGPSGAGKSTLLDLIAGRKDVGTYTGTMLFDGLPRGPFFLRETAYVMQQDILIPTLTVRETLHFASLLRMEEESTDDQRLNRVNKIIQLLGLTKCEHSMVGNALIRGISGGQLKRLSIGVEIIHMPSLIFLDEPTSGLDSAIAFEVMSVVRNLADQNRTILATIHQPSPETFNLFHKIVLLAHGRVVYFGSTDEVLSYFTSPELDYPYNEEQNPADFILEAAGGALTSNNENEPRTPAQLSALYEASHFAYKAPEEGLPTGNENRKIIYDRPLPTSTLTQCHILLKRAALARKRDKAYLRAQIGKNIVVGLLCGTIFWDVGTVDGPLIEEDGSVNSEAYNISSILFFAMMYNIMGNLQAIPQLFSQKVIFLRERASGSYTTFPYFITNALVSLPLIIVAHIIFTNISYWMIGLPSDIDIYLYYFFNTLFTNLCGFFFAQLLAAWSPSAQVSLAVFPVTFLFLSNFAGFTIQIPNVSDGWYWATYVSYPRWAYEGLMVKMFENEDDENEFLEIYGFDDFNENLSFLILFIFAIFMNFMVYRGLLPWKSKLIHSSASKLPKDGSKKKKKKKKNGNEYQKIDQDDDKASLLLDNNDIEQRYPSFDSQMSIESDMSTYSYDNRHTLSVSDYRKATGDVKLSRGCRLVFRNLKYFVPHPKDKTQRLQLLKGVSGRINPGEMCALMGASGAGKSTLLDVVAGRKNVGWIEGEILFNGNPRNLNVMKHSAYVMQDNVHIPVLTVRQTMYFASKLRMDQEYTDAERTMQVNKVLEMLGLDEVADSIVGDESLRGISGGQLKRLSIAVEIINLPDLIFLDEPTTGLDATIAYECMAAVRNLSNQNRTVMCTIHQPSPQTFHLFDKLLLLSDGLVVYFGPVSDVVDYFVNSPYKFPYTMGTNPADFVVNITGGFLRSHDGKLPSPNDFASLYESSELSRNFKENIETMIAMDLAAVVWPDNVTKEYSTSTMYQTKILCQRQILKTKKMRKPMVVAFLRHVIVSLFYGSLYNDLDDTQLQERMSLLFFSLMFMLLGHQQVMPIIFEERLLFYRERGAKAYSTFSYWMSNIVAMVPLTVINVLVYCAILYPMSGLNDGDGCFFYFWINLLTLSLIGYFYCQLLAAAAPTGQAAITIFPATLFFFIAFAGFIVLIPSMQYFLRCWAPYFSFARWSYQGLVRNEFSGTNNPFGDNPQGKEVFLEAYGFENYGKWYSMPILIVNLIGFRILTYLVLKYVNYEKR